MIESNDIIFLAILLIIGVLGALLTITALHRKRKQKEYCEETIVGLPPW